MGCESSNTVLQAQAHDLSPEQRIPIVPKRVSPMEILTADSLRAELKVQSGQKEKTKQLSPFKESTRKEISIDNEEKAMAESRRPMGNVVVSSSKQNSPDLFITIPDSSTIEPKAKANRRPKKAKKPAELPLQKELKRLYGL